METKAKKQNKLKIILIIAVAIIVLGVSSFIFASAPKTSKVNANTFNSSSLKYDTNFSTSNIDGIDVEIYRASKSNQPDCVMTIKDKNNYDSPDAMTGSLQNVTNISNTSKIKISAKSDKNYSVSVGNTPECNGSKYTVDPSSEVSEHTFDFDEPSNYFKVETGGSDVDINSLEVTYNGLPSISPSKQEVAHNIHRDIERNYDPSEGDTVTVQQYTLSDGKEVPAGSKTYTYHSFDYAKEHIEKGEPASKYALTDYNDVANYFEVFNRIPANYGGKNGPIDTKIQGHVEFYDDVAEVFGSDARVVQEFTKWWDGPESYTTTLKPNTSIKPDYYELDIKLSDSYGLKERGTGRIVGFSTGLSTQSENENRVFYTDDHYYTFNEYSNAGFWNERFDDISKVKTWKQY